MYHVYGYQDGISIVEAKAGRLNGDDEYGYFDEDDFLEAEDFASNFEDDECAGFGDYEPNDENPFYSFFC